jgi:Bacterial regulatory proteins, lacI family.
MYEKKFCKGLQKYINDNCLKKSAIAEKAGVRKDTFSRIINGKRRVFGEEIASICMAIGKSFDDIINYADDDSDEPKEPKAG